MRHDKAEDWKRKRNTPFRSHRSLEGEKDFSLVRFRDYFR